jgi:hypothetical protein
MIIGSLKSFRENLYHMAGSVTVLTICFWYLQTNMVTHSVPLFTPLSKTLLLAKAGS